MSTAHHLSIYYTYSIVIMINFSDNQQTMNNNKPQEIPKYPLLSVFQRCWDMLARNVFSNKVHVAYEHPAVVVFLRHLKNVRHLLLAYIDRSENFN